MHEVHGRDILESVGKVDACCITTNLTIKQSGEAVMGAGVALAFAKTYPHIPRLLGIQLRLLCYETHIIDRQNKTAIVALPTKIHWKNPSSLEMVIQSCKEQAALANEGGWKTITLPPPGCGNGGLDWTVVKKELEPILDDRFWVVFK